MIVSEVTVASLARFIGASGETIINPPFPTSEYAESPKRFVATIFAEMLSPFTNENGDDFSVYKLI